METTTRHEALDARRYDLRTSYTELARRVGRSLTTVWRVLRGEETLANVDAVLDDIERALDEIEKED